jgi:acetyl-CoA carboxylase carboxyl transferase subunit beta
MGWFTRKKEGIVTSTAEKKETPEGLWYKCPKCKSVVAHDDHEKSLHVCHLRSS